MADKKEIIVYKENIFSKIKKFFSSIFNKKVEVEIKPIIPSVNRIPNQKGKFNEYISFKENKEELKLIDSVRNDINILNEMSLEELDEVEKAVLNRINYVDKRISKLNTDLKMKKMGI